MDLVEMLLFRHRLLILATEKQTRTRGRIKKILLKKKFGQLQELAQEVSRWMEMKHKMTMPSLTHHGQKKPDQKGRREGEEETPTQESKSQRTLDEQGLNCIDLCITYMLMDIYSHSPQGLQSHKGNPLLFFSHKISAHT